MAVKTFTTGEVLTAADTNTYLANSGLVHVKSQTIGTAVSSVTVTNAFNSTYDNYFVQVFGGTGSSAQAMAVTLGATTTGYYGNLVYWSWTSATTNVANQANASNWGFVGVSSTNVNSMSFELQGPNLAKMTVIRSLGYVHVGTSGEMGIYSGFLNNTTQYTDLKITVGNTMTGGTIDIYGYRKG